MPAEYIKGRIEWIDRPKQAKEAKFQGTPNEERS